MSDNIPFEIQAEIMKRLPIKSLIQFRSVSKPWNSLITSSDFIADYHNRHTQPPEHVFVSYFDQQSRQRTYVSFLDNDDTFPINKFSPKVPETVIKLAEVLTLIGSSNGLFCFYNLYGNASIAVIWNPTIGTSVDIDLDIVYDSSYENVIGFGVSPHTLDPKLVKVRYLYVDEDNFDGVDFASWQVEVYTLSTRVWRNTLCSDLPRESIQLTPYVVDISGFLYFLGYELIGFDLDVHRSHLIISFDLKTEEFSEISLPNSLAYENSLGLSKLRESPVVFEFDFVVCDVWMIENDVRRSVTKLFTISLQIATMQSVFAFRKSGLPIIVVMFDYNERDGLFVYEPNSQISYYISGNSLFGGSYVETLLLLNH